MATRVQYNGLTIENVLTKMFNEEVVYDESNTDPVRHRFRMRWSGIVCDVSNLFATIGTFPRTVGQTTTEVEVALRRVLLEVRRELTVTVGESVLLHVRPERPDTGLNPSYQYDCDNGPKPISVSITHIAGSKTFRVEFEIEASVVDCQAISNTSGVLNNRWSVHDDIDENWYTTRTVTGTLRTKSSFLNPQAFRHLCIPPLQRGFRRQRIDCTTSPDGLTLRYAIVDREVHASCPLPGTTWEGTHTISALPDSDGGILVGDISMRLTGPKGVDKPSLIALAALICERKLAFNDEPNRVFLDGRIVDHLNENTIEMTARVMFTRKGLGQQDAMRRFAFNTLGFGQPLDKLQEPIGEYDSELSWVPPNYGTATTTGLFISYLQSPCASEHGIQGNTDSAPENNEEGPGSGESAHTPTVTHRTGEIETDPEISANYSDEHSAAIYNHYRIDVKYVRKGNKVALPIARSTSQSPVAELDDRPTCAVVQLGQPTVQRIVRISAERMHKPPALPKFPEVTTIGTLQLHLLDSVVEPKAPVLMADGKTKLWSIDCVYTFACSRPPRLGEEYQTGSLPWDNSTTADNYLPAEVETDGIIQ